MKADHCPKCQATTLVKSGVVGGRQRYLCKGCSYHFTVNKVGKKIDEYYVTKALQLYLEGLSLREIERIIGISHVSISSWVREAKIQRPTASGYRSQYRVFKHQELLDYLKEEDHLRGKGCVITEFGDKYILISWHRLK